MSDIINYIGYYRVSTDEQGQSGLGLASQKLVVGDFIKSVGGNLIAEYQDIESGTSDTRNGLLRAIEQAKAINAIIVVKEFSRITRGGYKIQDLLLSSGVTCIEAYAQHDPELVKVIKIEIGKEEVRKIKKRTKDALDQIKINIETNGFHVSKSGRVIKKLGNPDNLTEGARLKGIVARKEKALNNPNNMMAGALVVSLRDGGMSYNQIAKRLNESGFKTRRGCDFGRVQAQRLYSMYKYKK